MFVLLPLEVKEAVLYYYCDQQPYHYAIKFLESVLRAKKNNLCRSASGGAEVFVICPFGYNRNYAKENRYLSSFS